MLTKKTIYLIRHGQTDYNLQGIIQGRGIDSDLNEKGRMQAEAFFREYASTPFDKIYTSSLKRTQQSVASFTSKGIPTIIHEGLDEINWGVHEGQKATMEHKLMFETITGKWREGDLHFAPEGGESPHQLHLRQRTALDYLLEQKNEQNILVCMHGRAMRAFLCLMLNYPLQQMDDFPHTNLCLYKLAVDTDRRFELLEKNNTSHLSEAIHSHFP